MQASALSFIKVPLEAVCDTILHYYNTLPLHACLHSLTLSFQAWEAGSASGCARTSAVQVNWVMAASNANDHLPPSKVPQIHTSSLQEVDRHEDQYNENLNHISKELGQIPLSLSTWVYRKLIQEDCSNL